MADVSKSSPPKYFSSRSKETLAWNTTHLKSETSNDKHKQGEDCDCHQPWLCKETVNLPGFLPIICHLPLEPPDPHYRLGLTSTLGASPSFWAEINKMLYFNPSEN